LSEQNTAPPADDPFAETTADPFADAPAEQVPPPPTPEPPTAEAPPPPDAPPATAVEEIPTVDREGAPVAPGPLPTTAEDQEPPPAPDPTPDPDAGSQQPQVTHADKGLEQNADQMAPTEAAQAPQAPAEAPAQAPEPPAPPAAQEPQVPEAPQTQPPAPDPAASTSGEPESNGEGKKSNTRFYVVLYQTGPDQFTVAKLLDEKGDRKHGVVDVDGKPYLEARNNEHAYKLAFHILGSPKDGVTLWPIPKASYRPRVVKPAPPSPERERLVIS